MEKNYGVFGDVLAAAMIGSWKIEIDEGRDPRMYADATMMHLLGLAEDEQLTPEAVYHAWYDRIDPAHYDAVAEGVSYMLKGEHAEIQYPWHHPDGRVIVVRCGGVRDNGYTTGARIAGIHQWVTTMHHVNRDLEAQQRKLNKSLALVDGLSREYHTIWTIDAETHKLSLWRTTGVKTIKDSVEYGKARPDFDDSIVWYVKTYVDESDKARVLKAVSWPEIVANTPDVGIYSVSYKRHPSPGKTDYHQMCFAKAVSSSGKTNYVMAYRDVDAVLREKVEAEERHRRELEAALRKETEEKNHLTAIRDLINAVHWSFKLDGGDRVVDGDLFGNIGTLLGTDSKLDAGDRVVDGELFGNKGTLLGADSSISPLGWLSIVHPDDREMASSAFNAAIADHSGKTRYDVTYRMETANGKYKWFRSAGKVIENIDGSREFYGIHINVTDRVLMEQAQQKQIKDALDQEMKAVREAKAANKAKSDFLFNMSHDIRTPMNAITGFTAMAKKYSDDKAKVMDYLDKIDVSSQRLLTLINQVLEMSRIESGKVGPDIQPLNIKEKFDSMVAIVSAQARAKGLDFHYSFNDVRHFNVFADDAKMGQITLNIIGNAIKYTPEGGRIDFVLGEIPCENEGFGRFVFTAADTGIGMSKDFLEKIFEPFSRENSTTISKIQGTGLGMSIVKHLVDILGGTIKIQSEPGKGTRIDITVDLKLCDNSEKAASSLDAFAGISFNGRRVLLVEDNEMNREIAKDFLEEYGFVVEEADDGDVAVEKCRAAALRGDFGYYDLVLMDIQMPHMNGYDATRAIRAIPAPENIHLPIIAMTANAFDEDRKNALEAGMDEHLVKPFDAHKIIATIARFI